MKKILKHFVTFYSPGSFCADTWTEDVCDVSPDKIKFPDRAYYFTMHKQEDVVDGATVYKGESKQVGPRYYHPDSKVETLEQVRINPKASKTLIENMEYNRWEKIVWSRWGNWPQPFDDAKDVVLT